MQTIKITKEVTVEEIREDLSSNINLVMQELERIAGDLENVRHGVNLRVLNLSNIAENINVTRRDLYAVDQTLENISEAINAIMQTNAQPPSAPQVNTPPEEPQDD